MLMNEIFIIFFFPTKFSFVVICLPFYFPLNYHRNSSILFISFFEFLQRKTEKYEFLENKSSTKQKAKRVRLVLPRPYTGKLLIWQAIFTSFATLAEISNH